MNERVLLLAPHNDDEALFASYVVMRLKPLVVIVTDSFIQFRRGDPITAAQRRQETLEAMALLGADVTFLGIPDDTLTPRAVAQAIARWSAAQPVVFAPALQYGNRHHDIVSIVADALFQNVIHYATYDGGGGWYSPIGLELAPTDDEFQAKCRALECYKTQRRLAATAPHFDAVVQARSEWVDRRLPCT